MNEVQLMQQQQAQQLDADPQALYADFVREDKVRNILEQINPDNLLTDIEHRIRGEKKDFTGQWVLIARDKEPISEELVADFMSFLGSVLNQNTSMSNFKEAEINELMTMIIDWLSRSFRTNAVRYNIKGDYTEWDRIGHIVCLNCFSVFKRALNGSEARRVFKMMRVSENLTPERKGKFMDNFKFWN